MGPATTVSIPRFLLPLRGHMWRRAGYLGWPAAPAAASGGVVVRVRFGSSSASATSKPGASKPIVLEKPARFNPPSHGARLPKKGHMPRHYGGELSAEESTFQARRDYPGMPPPRQSMAHKILYNRGLHLFITLGTLTGLAVTTFVLNFKSTSPYIDMVPSWSDFLWHPISSMQSLVQVVQLTEMHNAAIVAEKRDKKVNDVLKRRRYRKAHGIEENEGISAWLRSGGNGLRDDEAEEEERQARAAGMQAPPVPGAASPALASEEGKGETEGGRKKFLGIF